MWLLRIVGGARDNTFEHRPNLPWMFPLEACVRALAIGLAIERNEGLVERPRFCRVPVAGRRWQTPAIASKALRDAGVRRRPSPAGQPAQGARIALE